VQKGWNASGLLQPLWGRVGGREELARITGVHTSTLSGVNSGRLNLGRENATKLAVALGVSLAELGAPEGEDDARGQTLRDRLEELATKLADSLDIQARQGRELRNLRGRVQKLEARHGAVAASSKCPPSRQAAG
jgi:transcriptional regulator with XRE-family HTH domain